MGALVSTEGRTATFERPLLEVARQGTYAEASVPGGGNLLYFGLGGLAGSTATDIARMLMGAAIPAYALVFMLESVLFLVSAVLAAGLARAPQVAPTKLVAAE